MPTRLKLCASLKGMRGSCMMPMWMTASTAVCRKASSTRALRRSTWWWSMSLGFPRKGRRSTPTTCVSVWSSLARARPRFPERPVTSTVRGIPGKVGTAAAGLSGGPLTGWLFPGVLTRTRASAPPARGR